MASLCNGTFDFCAKLKTNKTLPYRCTCQCNAHQKKRITTTNSTSTTPPTLPRTPPAIGPTLPLEAVATGMLVVMMVLAMGVEMIGGDDG